MLRLLIWQAQLFLVNVYSEQNKPARVLRGVLEFLSALSFVVEPSPFRIVKWGLAMYDIALALKRAHEALMKLDRFDDAHRAEVCMRTSYQGVVGEDCSFDETYKV